MHIRSIHRQKACTFSPAQKHPQTNEGHRQPFKGQHYRAGEPLSEQSPMEREIIDLNKANMLHSKHRWRACPQTHAKNDKWESFFLAQGQTRKGSVHVWAAAAGRENVGSPVQLKCMYRITGCSLSGSGVSQSAMLNINDSMQIKMSLFQWRRRQGQHVGGHINPFHPHAAFKVFVWLRG